MTILTSATDIDVAAHTEEFVRLKTAGWSYREIGDRFGISHEHIRRMIVADGRVAHTSARDSRRREVRYIGEWLETNGPVARNRVLDEFGISTIKLNSLIAEGLPSHLILTASRDVGVQFDDDAVTDALLRAWDELQVVNPDATGLSHVMYERLRRSHDPSAPLLVGRYGWENACVKFGVPPGESWRPKESYTSKWSDAEIMEAVAGYAEISRDARVKPSYLGYERYQQHDPRIPSGTLVRNRMRVLGYRTWPSIVEVSTGYVDTSKV